MQVDAQSVNTTPTASLCDSIRCGAYPDYSTVPGGVATVYACSQQYGPGVWAPCDSRCKPYWPTIAQNNPQFNPGTACAPKLAAPTAKPPVPTPVTLTPENIVPPLPDITRALEPVPAPVSKCSLWCDLNAAIGAHPVISLAVLLGAAYLVGRRRG